MHEDDRFLLKELKISFLKSKQMEKRLSCIAQLTGRIHLETVILLLRYRIKESLLNQKKVLRMYIGVILIKIQGYPKN